MAVERTELVLIVRNSPALLINASGIGIHSLHADWACFNSIVSAGQTGNGEAQSVYFDRPIDLQILGCAAQYECRLPRIY